MQGKIYRVGTLTYTAAALRVVFFWMLLGDFCLQLMESVVSVIPLQLRWTGANDFIIALITATGPAIIGFVCSPIVGVQSDRYRGKLGRRRPFLLFFTPLVVLSLTGLGVSKPLSALLYAAVPWASFGISEPGLQRALICFFASSFFIFNVYIIGCYNFLFRDVIPEAKMGTFYGFYRAIGAAGGFTFNRWMLGQAEGHTAAVFIGSALLYAVGFFLLIWKVKEGEYPPPAIGPKKGPFHEIRIYARECFCNTFYWKMYGVAVVFWAGFVPLMTYIVFFATSAKQPGYAATLGLTLDEYGKLRGWTQVAQFPFFLLAGLLCDKFHPLRVVLCGSLFTCLGCLAGFFFIQGGTGLLIWLSIISIGMAVFLAAWPTALARLLPADKFGQFSGALGLVFQSGLILIPLLAGWLLGIFKDYRLLFLWTSFFNLLGFFCATSLFLHWKRLGGDKNYSPPVYEQGPASLDHVKHD